jgi:hypothetical protein
MNRAVTLPLPVTTHGAVPLHVPVQPVNTAPADGVAVKVTEPGKIPLHAPGQLIPAGELVTVPGPLALTETEDIDVKYGLSDRSGHPGRCAR